MSIYFVNAYNTPLMCQDLYVILRGFEANKGITFFSDFHLFFRSWRLDHPFKLFYCETLLRALDIGDWSLSFTKALCVINDLRVFKIAQ